MCGCPIFRVPNLRIRVSVTDPGKQLNIQKIGGYPKLDGNSKKNGYPELDGYPEFELFANAPITNQGC